MSLGEMGNHSRGFNVVAQIILLQDVLAAVVATLATALATALTTITTITTAVVVVVVVVVEVANSTIALSKQAINFALCKVAATLLSSLP
jgi:hypothetical protein